LGVDHGRRWSVVRFLVLWDRCSPLEPARGGYDSCIGDPPPSHGSLSPQDQHVIIFTPAPGYTGQDSFTLSMREHNGARRATMSVKVSVTIR
jgi:hypothetical protein